MSFTRFYDDPNRIQARVENSAYAGKYFLETPAVEGENRMPFQEDPHIRLQRWGANMTTSPLDVENQLFGLDRRLNRDYMGDAGGFYSSLLPTAGVPISYSSEHKINTDETRASNPAWLLRGIEIPRWEEPFLNPQANLEKTFADGISTRNEEKDNFRRTAFPR